MSIAERCRDRGFDTTISFDDSPKHSKSYRQISSIPAKIPSRDASPSDIPNIHASISFLLNFIRYFNHWTLLQRLFIIISLILLIIYILLLRYVFTFY